MSPTHNGTANGGGTIAETPEVVQVADEVSLPGQPPDGKKKYKSVTVKFLKELGGDVQPDKHRVNRPAQWGITLTMLIPIVGSVVWFGCVPVGPPQGNFGDKAVFVFVVNPCMLTFLSYLLISLFFMALDYKSPWRPFISYFPILVVNYLSQLIFPGLVVLLREPHELMALPAIALTVIVTLVGIAMTPGKWGGPHVVGGDGELDEFKFVFRIFRRICIVFIVYTWILALFMIAQVKARGGVGQGFVTVAINVVAFIFKKILLAMTDNLDIETSMIVAGLWVENLTDVFIVIAFPTAEEFKATFAIVFVTRILENMATLAFQLDIWFKFRVWIKGKFKPNEKQPIEEDIDSDDRGHSNSHPGYRRRQFRFLTWKFASQVQSYLFFLILIPVLRFGPNNNRFGYSSTPTKLTDTHLTRSLQALSTSQFEDSMVFAVISLCTVFIAMGISFWWMRRYHKDILITLSERYDAMVVSAPHYALVLSIITTNSLIAIMYLQVYYRVYFL